MNKTTVKYAVKFRLDPLFYEESRLPLQRYSDFRNLQLPYFDDYDAIKELNWAV